LFALVPDFSLETDIRHSHGGPVAGVDEAGRGPLAGPVVAAAVILDEANIPTGINDSKAISENKRQVLYDQLHECAEIGVTVCDVGRIERDNVLQATLWSMTEAINKLPRRVSAVLVDGNHLPRLSCHAKAVIKGDQKSLSIAAASIIAKVTRDKLMRELACEFPGYGWGRNKGYGTREHMEAIKLLGITPHHRRSFAPIRNYIQK
jgi:ribonuclease HII